MKKILKDLSYRMKRFFQGESGVVEKVELASLTDNSGQIINYYKDYYGNLPEQVTFKNPLGELVTRFTPLSIKPITTKSCSLIYKSYVSGDNFP